jgi:hypothetical protein
MFPSKIAMILVGFLILFAHDMDSKMIYLLGQFLLIVISTSKDQTDQTKVRSIVFRRYPEKKILLLIGIRSIGNGSLRRLKTITGILCLNYRIYLLVEIFV